MVYPALIPLMPVVDLTDALADLNGLVRFAKRRNLVSALCHYISTGLYLYLCVSTSGCVCILCTPTSSAAITEPVVTMIQLTDLRCSPLKHQTFGNT